MRIVIDQDLDKRGNVIATHHIDIKQDIQSPEDSTDVDDTRLFQMLYQLNKNPDMRDQAGWNYTRKLAGEERPTSRWQRLVKHTDSIEGHPALKAMKLTVEGEE